MLNRIVGQSCSRSKLGRLFQLPVRSASWAAGMTKEVASWVAAPSGPTKVSQMWLRRLKALTRLKEKLVAPVGMVWTTWLNRVVGMERTRFESSDL